MIELTLNMIQINKLSVVGSTPMIKVQHRMDLLNRYKHTHISLSKPPYISEHFRTNHYKILQARCSWHCWVRMSVIIRKEEHVIRNTAHALLLTFGGCQREVVLVAVSGDLQSGALCTNYIVLPLLPPNFARSDLQQCNKFDSDQPYILRIGAKYLVHLALLRLELDFYKTSRYTETA